MEGKLKPKDGCRKYWRGCQRNSNKFAFKYMAHDSDFLPSYNKMINPHDDMYTPSKRIQPASNAFSPSPYPSQRRSSNIPFYTSSLAQTISKIYPHPNSARCPTTSAYRNSMATESSRKRSEWRAEQSYQNSERGYEGARW